MDYSYVDTFNENAAVGYPFEPEGLAQALEVGVANISGAISLKHSEP